MAELATALPRGAACCPVLLQMEQEKGACGWRLELDNPAGPTRLCPPPRWGLRDLVLHPGFPLQSISMKISLRGLDLDQAGGSRVAGAVSWSAGTICRWPVAASAEVPSSIL